MSKFFAALLIMLERPT